MRFTIWQHKPREPTTPHPLVRGVEEFEVCLVHWPDDQECRAITLTVDPEGNVVVEHSTGEASESSVSVEQISRVTVPGWGE